MTETLLLTNLDHALNEVYSNLYRVNDAFYLILLEGDLNITKWCVFSLVVESQLSTWHGFTPVIDDNFSLPQMAGELRNVGHLAR